MPRLLATLILLVATTLTGCAQMESMRLGQDRPEDLKPLVEEHEYARARQLTGRYPQLDTAEIQAWITQQESAWEAAIFEQARTLENSNDLLGAVTLLSDALQKIPHSTLLRELRNSIETERVAQLRTNEREQMVSRAAYMVEQQQLYRAKVNLETPSLTQRWENKRNEKEARELAAGLLEHGEYALQHDQLKIATECLQLSAALEPSAEADALLAEISSIEASRKQVEIKQASIKKAKKQRRVKQKQKDVTREKVEQTRTALSQNDLQTARVAFVSIPGASRKHKDVVALQGELETAIDARVSELLVTGDAQYRADRVLEAVRTWTEGLSLDPENPELRERVDRANRVLAKLEELKRAQAN